MLELATLTEPDYFSHPDWSISVGEEVGEIATMANIPPYPEQQLLLDEVFALDPEDPDRPASFSAAAVVARQQLKTGWLKQLGLGWLFVMPQPLVVWTAHEFSTSQEALNDMIALIASCPDLDRRISKIRTGSLQPSIEILPQYGGARLMFKARTNSGGRGLTGSKVILDEGFALEPSMMGALLPTMISKHDAQVVYASSAGMAKSRVLRGVRDRGRVGSARAMYAEWLSEKRECAVATCDHEIGRPGCALDDIDLWRKACIITARRDFETMGIIADLRRELEPDEFMRECLGWWDEPTGDSPVGEKNWAGLLDTRSSTSAPRFALDVSPRQDAACIVAAGPNADGRTHVEITSRDEVFDHRPGVDWVAFRLGQMAKNRPGKKLTVHIAAGSAAESLVPDIVAAGVTVEKVPPMEVSAACGRFLTRVNQSAIAHLGQDELTDAVLGARQKFYADKAFIWMRPKPTFDLTPMYAATLAVWAASEKPYDPMRNIR